MPTNADIMGLLVPLAIVIAQMVTLIRLGMVMRRGRGQIMSARLGRHFGIWLVVGSAMEMVVYGSLICGVTGYSGDAIGQFMQAHGAAWTTVAWTCLAIPLCWMLVDPRRLVRTGWATALLAAMAVLAGAVSGSQIASLAGAVAARGGLDRLLRDDWVIVAQVGAMSAIIFAATALPMVGMILLIVHVGRARQAAGAGDGGKLEGR